MRVTNEAETDGRSTLRKRFDMEYEKYLKRKHRAFNRDRKKYANDQESLVYIDAAERYEEDSGKEEMFEFWLQNFVLPDTERGKIIVTSARKGGVLNTEEIRKKHGGKLLADRKPELEDRLREFMKKGHSKRRACQLLANQKDVYWVAEYLRKNLKE
jgi:hypothetical protein